MLSKCRHDQADTEHTQRYCRYFSIYFALKSLRESHEKAQSTQVHHDEELGNVGSFTK